MADNGDLRLSFLSNIVASVNDQELLPFLKKILSVALITVIMFFWLARKPTTDLAANDQVLGGNIQPPTWLLEWLNSGDISSQKLNLQCEKVPDDNSGKGWTLRCENLSGEGGEYKYQTFTLQLDNSQKISQPYNETGKSLCCHPCHYTPVPPAPTPAPAPAPEPTAKSRPEPTPKPRPEPTPPAPVPTPSETPIQIIITGVINITKTSIYTCARIVITSISIWRRIVVELVSELTTVAGIYIHKCQYHSETMSTEFEMELKKMLQKELLRQIEANKETCKSKACLDRYPSALGYQFKNKFNDILKTSLHQISEEIEEGSIHSAYGNELITEHEQISSAEQANYAEVVEHHQQISVEQSHKEEVIKEEKIVVEESAEVTKQEEIVVEEAAEVIILPTAT